MSFEVGIEQLGAQPMFLNANDIQLRVGETIKDTANVMSRYVDCIMIRTFAQKDVEDLAEYGQIPVINGLTDDHHPCQGMADALTIREHVRPPRGRQARLHRRRQQRHPLARRGRRQDRHARGLLHAGRTTARTRTSSPGRRRTRSETGATIELTDDVRAAVRGADVIYTDTFTSMGQEAEHDVRLAALRDYQVNMDLVQARRPAGQGHALPAGALGRGDHRRGAVLAALRGLRPGGEPAARAEGDHGGGHRVARRQPARRRRAAAGQIQLGNHMMCSKYSGEIGSPSTIGTNATTMPIDQPGDDHRHPRAVAPHARREQEDERRRARGARRR